MTDLLRAAPWHETSDPELRKEWLVTNGLGGYASGTVVGKLTRRYHGLLIAALPNPLGRFMMLNALDEILEADHKSMFLGTTTFSAGSPAVPMPLAEFRLEEGLPVWIYQGNSFKIEKRLLLDYGQNTVRVSYRLCTGESPVQLHLRPGVNFRFHDAPVSVQLAENYAVVSDRHGCELSVNSEIPALRLACEPHSTLILDNQTVDGVCFGSELHRGYDHVGALYSPGHYSIELRPAEQVTFIASAESWQTIETLSSSDAQQLASQRRRALLQDAQAALRSGIAAELVLAADQFLIKPASRRRDEIWARAAGDEVRTVIAGYHWFNDWGRDTMISLEGLTLTTGRREEAGWILRTFAHYIRDGLIPNMFPEGQESGLYHTADATLWFFHALARYLDYTDDVTTLSLLLPRLNNVIDAHLNGTRFGIKVDSADGLLRQGEPGYQLTWMDAKVDDWVVTPRRGKAVEINALWYNALCCMSGWMKRLGQAGGHYSQLADHARISFNERFWCEPRGHLYDVVDGEGGDDPSCRPNQIFAISLPHPVLNQDRWQQVVDVVTKRLLTPVGLRSLCPGEPNYRAKYDGDLRSRDAAYHQGSVWAWLIGPYIDAWMKVNPGQPGRARHLLDGFVAHLDDACVGSISEIFDAEPPHTPRACIAQAWSVAEVLRCWAKTST